MKVVGSHGRESQSENRWRCLKHTYCRPSKHRQKGLQKGNVVFQTSIFRCEMLVSGRVVTASKTHTLLGTNIMPPYGRGKSSSQLPLKEICCLPGGYCLLGWLCFFQLKTRLQAGYQVGPLPAINKWSDIGPAPINGQNTKRVTGIISPR